MIKGVKFTQEHRNNISNSLKGRKLSEEQKRKMSEAKKGKLSNCAKTVTIIYKNIEYNFSSMTNAEDYFLEHFNIKIFYWLRRSIPKKHIADVQLIKVGQQIKHQQES